MVKTFNDKRSRYYLRDIIKTTGLNNTPVAFGAEKKCHIFKDFVVFNHPTSDLDQNTLLTFTLNLLVKFQNTQYLANYGIKTPRIMDIQFNNNSIYEIQERAPGQVLSYTNESNILHVFGEREKGWTGLSDMSEGLRANLINNVLAYNLTMQKKMKSAPISHFVEFIRGFKDIQEYGLDLDIHGENFLYDTEKGFSFIDLPLTQSTPQKNFTVDNIDYENMTFNNKKIKSIKRFRQVSDFCVARQVCGLFGYFLKYCNYSLKSDNVMQMKKNNYSIYKNKLLPAIRSTGFNLTDEEWKILMLYISKFTHKKFEVSSFYSI